MGYGCIVACCSSVTQQPGMVRVFLQDHMDALPLFHALAEPAVPIKW